MKGIGLFVSCKLGKKLLFSTDYSATCSDFFGLPVEGAVELFLSKRPCVEDSILDLTLDSVRYLSLPSTLTAPFNTFLKPHSCDSFSDLQLYKTNSEVLGAKTCKHKANAKIARCPTAPLNVAFGQQEEYSKNIDIKLFTIVFVVNTSAATVEQLSKYIELLKAVCTLSL